MKLAPRKLFHCVVPCAFIGLLGCAVQPDVDAVENDQPPPVVETVVDALATAATGEAAHGAPPVTAEIVDVINGGPGGEWGVKVDFPNGTGEGCYVDVFDKRAEQLLARDEVRDSPDKSTSHMVRFRYRGAVESLTIRVLEIGSGNVLTESEFR